jgi:ATP-dependent Clp protease ATP-binding subunit ClpA
MFERFTIEARRVLVDAQDVAVELDSAYISTGHLLYGCAESADGVAAEPLIGSGLTAPVIRRLLPRPAAGGERASGDEAIDREALLDIGIDYDDIRIAVEASFGPGALESAPDRRHTRGGSRRPRFTPSAKKSLELALRAAVNELHHDSMRPGHLLLGLLRVDDTFVSEALARSGTSASSMATLVLDRMGQG